MDQKTIHFVSTPRLNGPAQGTARVPYRVFSDPEIYREELARIFLGPSWQFLALPANCQIRATIRQLFSARPRSLSPAGMTAKFMPC